MTEDKLQEKIVLMEDSMRQLMALAPQLNNVRDTLREGVEQFEAVLKKLNLGVSAWVISAQSEETVRKVGYTKYAGHWGIHVSYDGRNGEDETIWSFGDSPSYMRAEAIPLFPELLAKLVTNTQQHIALMQLRCVELMTLMERISPS